MKQLLIIFLSVFSFGSVAQADHWESAILPGDSWRYLVPTSQPTSDWRQAAFDDSQWLTGSSGIGYADGDDATVIPSTTALFMRTQFTVHRRHFRCNTGYRF